MGVGPGAAAVLGGDEGWFESGAVWSVEDELVVLSFQLVAAFVAEVVVVGAQQGEVVEVGVSAVLPKHDVMRVAPAGRPAASGERAAAVAEP